jgi:NAD(P)-dependent dehydrogenase (short-subunit alcohol dehydrogenase family)
VRVNCIAPGTVRTPIWNERVEEQPNIFEQLAKWYPLQRVGEPNDIANAALFLASGEASWITGETLVVDGGLLAGSRQFGDALGS